MQPIPAAVIACRYVWSTTSPAANTPSTFVSRRSRLRDDVAGVVELQLADEELRVRIVADRDEEAVGRELGRLVGVDVANRHARDRVLAEHFLDDGVRDELDLLVRARTVLHDLRGPELLAPVDERDLVGELRQEDRLLHGGVAAADDDDLLLAEERGVADGAVGDAAGLEPLLGRKTELPRVAPVAMITASARYSSSPTQMRNGCSEKSTRVTSSVTNSAPKRSAWRRKSFIISGPEHALGDSPGSSRRRS